MSMLTRLIGRRLAWREHARVGKLKLESCARVNMAPVSAQHEHAYAFDRTTVSVA